MTTSEPLAAPRNTEEQLVGQTFTLWLWPYCCLREEARLVVSGLTKDKADEIMEREKDRAPGVMFLEPDEMPNNAVHGRQSRTVQPLVGHSESGGGRE